MTDREKLIELLEEFPKICANGVDCKDCQYNKENGGVGCTSLLADHLISNRVVVRNKGEWIFGHTASGKVYTICSVCNTDFSIREKSGSFAKINMDGVNYCPNCGADMRGEQHDD